MAQRVTDLSPEMLKNQGIQLLMLDFDNTLIPYTTDIPTDAVLQWLQTVQESGIQVCIVSNSKKPRVRVFCEKYGLPCVTHAKKPFSRGIRQCMERFKVPPSGCALVLQAAIPGQ